MKSGAKTKTKAPAAKPVVRAKKAAKADKPYHHGNLREKLIAATEALILERGVDGFSLREVARRAGVSPAAPAHHFGDAKGLLSELALMGFEEFGNALAAADARGGNDPKKRLYEQGEAYVRFALKRPARFTLMFRHDVCDMNYRDLANVGHRSFLVLESAVRAATGLTPDAPMTPDAWGMLMAMWSIVHGFAHLALSGDFNYAAAMRGGKDVISTSFLPLMLQHLPAVGK